MMPQLFARILQHPWGSKMMYCLLIIASLTYVVVVRRVLYPPVSTPVATISEHIANADNGSVLQYWTTAKMDTALDDDLLSNTPFDASQDISPAGAGTAAQQEGQIPPDNNIAYPLSTVGKVFFSDSSGRDYVCSGTAIASLNHNVVDTAGHCLYWNRDWMSNVLFCPLYERGNTPYGCWAAHALEVPADWIGASLNDLHHDFGMAIVDPNDQGNLTEVVGGAGWTYNQPAAHIANQPFYAYGYPAGHPFDGQTRQSCEGSTGKLWQHGGGTVVSIPCNMTGGSSGGPWFIRNGDNWYLNGHNDFTSTIQPGHMFSPYYDDTWYALYNKAQHS